MTAAPLSSRPVSPSPTVPARLTVDLAALRNNYRLLKQAAGTAAVAGIVKANAYGLGMEQVVRVLESEACPHYFVATLEEAIALRALTNKPIAMLGGLWAGCENEYLHHDITPVLNSLDEIARWHDTARNNNQGLSALIHFDTGMNRLGITLADTDILLNDFSRLDGLDVQMVMSHFACADEKDSPMNAAQFQKFSTIASRFPNAQKSLANSYGLFRNPAYCFDMVRPGIALYGGNPAPEGANKMNPVVSLNTLILQVKSIPENETIGYNATYRFKKEARVATVALGYADGFFRSNSNKAILYLNGRPCPVIGRVSMDLVTIDIGDQDARPGDMVEVIGPHQSVDDLAASAGTISYEVLTSLGHRFERSYEE
ncbi:MAG: alanine racemase [Rhodospirillales bacterium]|nr:alanine racemase [Rhodospirillales bacterium]